MPAGTRSTRRALTLAVGQRYQWRVTIDGEMHEEWLAGFTVTG
jgi:hypothetical protein